MTEEKSNKIEDVIKYNNELIDKITNDMEKYKEDLGDDVTLLILEKQIGTINFLRKQIDYYKKVDVKIEKDKKAGKKTTLKKMKKVSIDESKNTKKELSDEKPKKKATIKKKQDSD